MRTILIGVIAVAGFALIEGMFHTLRYFRERNHDELRRRLQSLGVAAAGSTSLLREGNLSKSASIDAVLRMFPATARAKAMLGQAEVHMTVARRLSMSAVGILLGVVFGFLSNFGFLMSLVLAPVGAVLPFGYVAFKRTRRSN